MQLRLICFVAALVFVPALSASAKDGLLTQPSNYSAEETLQRLESEIGSRGFRIFGKLDHAAAAKDVQLEMPFSTVLVFGNPKLGTPSFILKPKLAIDLPLKALVWEDANGKVWVSYNSSEYLFQTIYKNRHGAPINEQVQANVENGLAAIVSAAVQ